MYNSYELGGHYETFIVRAWNCQRGEHGAEHQLMEFLLRYEDGDNKLHLAYDVQLLMVRNNLLKATDKFLKRKLKPDDKERLMQIAQAIRQAENAKAMAATLLEGIRLMNAYYS